MHGVVKEPFGEGFLERLLCGERRVSELFVFSIGPLASATARGVSCVERGKEG